MSVPAAWRLPVTPELAAQLDVLATKERRRILLWVAGLAPSAWVALLVGKQSSPAEATSYVGAFLIAGVAFAMWWARRIAAVTFVVRVSGMFYATGRFRQRLSGDKTRRSFAGPTGTLMLDGGDQALQRLWDRVNAKRSRAIRLVIDHTPRRYVLAIAGDDGALLYAREGYPRPSADAVADADALAPGGRPSDWLRPVWPLALGVVALAASWAVWMAPTSASAGTLLWSAQIWIALGMVIAALALLVIAAFRAVVTVGEWMADPRRGWAR